jgi:hypothetical protein
VLAGIGDPSRRFKKNSGAQAGRLNVCGCCTGVADSGIMPPIKYWEIIADKLSAAGRTWGYCSAVTTDSWWRIVDAHKNDRNATLFILKTY